MKYLQLTKAHMKGRTCENDVSVVGRSAYDEDIDGAGERRGVDVFVVLVWRADGADCTAQVVHTSGCVTATVDEGGSGTFNQYLSTLHRLMTVLFGVHVTTARTHLHK